MQGGHCAHAQVGEVLQLGQVGQLQVQRVHYGPPVDRDDADDWPAEHHEDVVGEDQVIDDGEEQEGEQAEHGKDRKGPQPRHHLLLVLLAGTERDGDYEQRVNSKVNQSNHWWKTKAKPNEENCFVII